MQVVKFSKELQGTEHITDNFQIKEFACKDNSDEILVDIDLVKILQKIRNDYGAIRIVCGYRTEAYNYSCGGAKNSKHLTGEAIDFTPIKNCNKAILLEIAKQLEHKYNIKGIGLYINRAIEFIHFDNRKNKVIWPNDNQQQVYIDTFDNIKI